MNKWTLFLSLFLLLSCDTTEDKYLYDKDDFEYAWAQALQAQDCIENATVFSALETAGSFETSGHLNKIYKVSQDDNDKVHVYLKITAVSALDMTIAVQSSESQYNKLMVFEKTDHDALMTEFKIMSCNDLYSTYFSASGLSSDDKLSLTWKRESIYIVDSEDDDDDDDEPETYDRQTDTYSIDKDLPLFFFFYSGSKTTNRITQKGESEVEKKSVLTITEVTSADECTIGNEDLDSNCNFEDITDLVQCDIVVNSESYLTHAYINQLVSLTPATDECRFLESGK
jgi:hypothetical protein